MFYTLIVAHSLRPRGHSLWNSPGQNTGVGSLFPSPGDLSNPGIKSRSPTLQADLLPAEPQGKPKNTGVSSLSLLQWIFQILYSILKSGDITLPTKVHLIQAMVILAVMYECKNWIMKKAEG